LTYPKMNLVVKELWIKELRSGKRAQCTGLLVEHDGGKRSYCCIGVLESLAVREGVIKKFKRKKASGDDNWSGKAESIVPSDETQEWAGLRVGQKGIGPWAQLAKLNDTEGFNFNQIADWIEENL
jgi:hypothetical protein